MGFVHDLTVQPPPRYDSVPWNRARIEESVDNAVFSPVETLALSPIDADPTRPARLHLTTSQATLASGWFRAVMLDAPGNESPPSPSVLSPSRADDAYPALELLLAESSDAELLDLATDEQLALRASAINVIERWAGQSFVQEGTPFSPVEHVLEGTGTGTLWLPKRLAQLVDLTIFGSWLTAADVRVSEEGDRLEISPSNVAGGTWLDRAMADMTFDGATAAFDAGPGRVRVSGVWGWTDDEWAAGKLAAVQRAIRMDMEDHAGGGEGGPNPLASTVATARSLGVTSLSQGNVSLALGAGGEPVVSERVQRELQGLRWRGNAVAVA